MSEYRFLLLNLHIEKRENHTAVNTKRNKRDCVVCEGSCWVHRYRSTFANDRQRKEESEEKYIHKPYNLQMQGSGRKVEEI